VSIQVPFLFNKDVTMHIGETNSTFFVQPDCCPYGLLSHCQSLPSYTEDPLFVPGEFRYLEYDGLCSSTGQLWISIYNRRGSFPVKIWLNDGRSGAIV
jgi:hypothetical protein